MQCRVSLSKSENKKAKKLGKKKNNSKHAHKNKKSGKSNLAANHINKNPKSALEEGDLSNRYCYLYVFDNF